MSIMEKPQQVWIVAKEIFTGNILITEDNELVSVWKNEKDAIMFLDKMLDEEPEYVWVIRPFLVQSYSENKDVDS